MRRIKKFKKSNQLIALLLAAVLSLSMGATTFAAEPQTTPEIATESTLNTDVTQAETPVEVGTAVARSASGYAAHYTDALKGSFYVNVSGSASSGKSYMKAWDFPSTADVYVSLYRPDGSTAFANVKLPIGTEISRSFSNLPAGQYRVYYAVFGTDKGWIYNSISG